MTSFFFFIIALVSIVNSQTTICVWNSIDFYDYLNGEYTIASGDYGGNAYWERYTPTSCATRGHPGAYIFAGYYAADDFYYWTIHSSLDSSDLAVDDYPECGNDWEAFAANPTLCAFGWQEWADDVNYIALPLTLTSGACPALSCPFMEVTNSGISGCDKVYSKSADHENVYIYNGNISPKYLYFNMYQFKWFFSDTLGVADCTNEVDITYHTAASLNDKWKEMNVGESFTLRLDNDEVATFSCLSTTKSPTKSPTGKPSTPPTTRRPTEAPITPGSPTKSPTEPTPNPTVSPTDYTNAPTSAPTFAPTLAPTEAPSIATTISPTRRTRNKAIDEANHVAKQWNTTIQSSLYTVAAWGVLFCICLLYVYWRRKSLKEMRKNRRMMARPVCSVSGVKSTDLSAPSMPKQLSVLSSVDREIARRNKKKKARAGNRSYRSNTEVSEMEMSQIRSECAECGKTKYANQGKMDTTDGRWYCFVCWKQYE